MALQRHAEVVRAHRQAEFPGKVVADLLGRDTFSVCLDGAQGGIPERRAWLRLRIIVAIETISRGPDGVFPR